MDSDHGISAGSGLNTRIPKLDPKTGIKVQKDYNLVTFDWKGIHNTIFKFNLK